MKSLELVIILSFLAIVLSPFLFFYFTEGILITEVVPSDQNAMKIPALGDHIEVYGVWVNDRHGFMPDWNEVHPVRYMKNLKTNEEWGNRNYNNSLMDGVYGPYRLKVLDEKNPYRIARGAVVDSFVNPEDGDWHIQLMLDDDYQYLAKGPKPLFYIPVIVLFGVPITVFVVSLGIWVYKKIR